MNVENRTIFEGDNLHILRGLDSETIDLIYLDPRSRGGSDAPDNLQLLCAACNSTKGNRTQEDLIGSLREQGVLR